MLTLAHFLTLGALLFVLGVAGIFLNRKNVIILLMCIELMLLAVNINLVAFSTHMGDLVGQVFAVFVLTVAAAEAAIGIGNAPGVGSNSWAVAASHSKSGAALLANDTHLTLTAPHRLPEQEQAQMSQ